MLITQLNLEVSQFFLVFSCNYHCPEYKDVEAPFRTRLRNGELARL